MGWSKHHPLGLIYLAPQSCYRGYTLIANSNGGHYAHLVDMEGHICHRWHADAGISYASLLPNGHLLVRTLPPQDAGPATGFPGGSTSILELDWDSNLVWAYRHPMLHHDFERLPNGNTLVLLWEEMPARLAARAAHGLSSCFLTPWPAVGTVFGLALRVAIHRKRTPQNDGIKLVQRIQRGSVLIKCGSQLFYLRRGIINLPVQNEKNACRSDDEESASAPNERIYLIVAGTPRFPKV